MTSDKRYSDITDPAPDAEWEVWYQDLFDRETPRQVEISGRGLMAGLSELWARHLFETVGVDGQKGFSRFNLWWKQPEKSVMVTGVWDGMVRLRKWIFGSKRSASKGYLDDGDKDLLMKVAMIHSCMVLVGQASELILAAAENSTSRSDFEGQLLNLKQGRIRRNDAQRKRNV